MDGVSESIPAAVAEGFPSVVMRDYAGPQPDFGFPDLTSYQAPGLEQNQKAFRSGLNALFSRPPPPVPSHGRHFLMRNPFTGRLRTPQACEICRERKTKCTGTRPACKRCFNRGLTCVYVLDHKANRRKNKTKANSKSRGGEVLMNGIPAFLRRVSRESNAKPSSVTRAFDSQQEISWIDLANKSMELPPALAPASQVEINVIGPDVLAPPLQRGSELRVPAAPVSSDFSSWERIWSGAGLGLRVDTSEEEMPASATAWSSASSCSYPSSTPSSSMLAAQLSASTGTDGSFEFSGLTPSESYLDVPTQSNISRLSSVLSTSSSNLQLQPDSSHSNLSSSWSLVPSSCGEDVPESVGGPSKSEIDEVLASIFGDDSSEEVARGASISSHLSLGEPLPTILRSLSSSSHSSSSSGYLTVPVWSWSKSSNGLENDTPATSALPSPDTPETDVNFNKALEEFLGSIDTTGVDKEDVDIMIELPALPLSSPGKPALAASDPSFDFPMPVMALPTSFPPCTTNGVSFNEATFDVFKPDSSIIVGQDTSLGSSIDGLANSSYDIASASTKGASPDKVPSASNTAIDAWVADLPGQEQFMMPDGSLESNVNNVSAACSLTNLWVELFGDEVEGAH
ncbi:hypothetical protein AcW2_004818 [Taiwanofungus camphoratus]|nr:hypothetical protein AcW2_004818 [Antrodia cinnamomea]